MPNILYFEVSSGSGGSARCLIDLLGKLNKEKFAPLVVATNKGSATTELQRMGHEVLYMRRRYLGDSLGIIPAAVELMSYMRARKIDIVHANNSPTGNVPAILAAKLFKISCVCHGRSTKNTLVKRARLFGHWVNTFIVLNEIALGIYKGYFPKSKSVVIYDGLNLQDYIPDNGGGMKQEFGVTGGTPCVGVFGRLVEGKGYDTFVEAAARVRERIAEAKFFIVGSDLTGDKSVENKLRQLVQHLKLDDNVVLTGWRDDALRIMAMLDVVVQPTDFFEEGMSRIILEGMALKKPVVATDIPGSSEAVANGKTGFLVPPKKPDAMAEALLTLLGNRDLIKQMGEQGRKRVEELFDMNKNIKQIEEIYEDLLIGKTQSMS